MNAKIKNITLLIIYSGLIFFSSNTLFAIDYQWEGSLSSDWNTPANWNPVGVPSGAADNVEVVAGAPNNLTNIPAGTNINNLTTQASTVIALDGALTLTGALDLSGTLNTGNFALQVGGATVVNGGGQLNSTGGDKTFTGVLTASETVNLTASNVTFGNRIIGNNLVTTNQTNFTYVGALGDLPSSVSQLYNLSIGGSVSLMQNGLLVISGNLSVTSSAIQGLRTDAFALTVNGNTDVNAGTSITSMGGTKIFTGPTTNGGTINMNSTTVSLGNYSGGTFTTNNASNVTFTNAGNVTFGAGSFQNAGNVVLDGAGTVQLGDNLIIHGNLNINFGTFNTNTRNVEVTGATDIDNGSSYTSSGGTKTFTGAVTSAGTLNLSGAASSMGNGLSISGETTVGTSLAITGNLLISSGVLNTAHDIFSVSGTTNITGGSLISSSNNKTFTGAVTTASILNLSGSVVIMNNGLSVNGGTTTINNSLVVNGAVTSAATLNLSGSTATMNNGLSISGGTTTVGNSLEITGALAVSGGTLATEGSTFTAHGTTNLTGGAITSSGGTKIFHGAVTSSATLSLSGSTATMNNGLSISGGATTVGSSLVVNGALEISAGTLATLGGAFTANGTTNLTGGSITSSGGTKNFVGDVTNISSMTFNNSIVNLRYYSGAGAFNTDNLTTLNLSNGSNITFASNSLANLSHLNMTGANVTISRSLTIANSLTVTNGVFQTGSNALTVNGATIISTTLNSTGGSKNFNGSFTNNGTGTITLLNTTATFGNAFTNNGTFTTDNTTSLVFTGSTAVTLPADAPRALAALTINKSAENVNLASHLQLGNSGGTVLTISGAAHLDLQGFNVTMMNANDVINELVSAGTIINSGALGAYIETANNLTTAQVSNSGIGIFNISPANATADHRVRRYPQKATYLINCTATITRIYEFIGDMTGISNISLRYAVSEIDGVAQSSLNVFRSAALPFALPTFITSINAAGSPFGSASVATTPVDGEFFTLVSVDPAKGITKTFTGAVDNDWDNANNWMPPCIPEYPDFAVIPNGKQVVTTNNISAATITMHGNSTLNIGHNAVIAGRSDGGITLNGTSSITISAAINLEIGTDEYRGDIAMNDNSTLTFSGGASNVTLSGTWTKAANATIVNTTPANYDFVGQTPLVLPLTLNNAVNVNIDKFNSSVTLSDNFAISADLDILRGTFVIGNNNLSVTGTTGIAANATLNADYSTNNPTRVFTGIVTINGTLSSSGPRIESDFNNRFVANLAIPATGILNINYSKTMFEGTVTGVSAGATIHALGADARFVRTVTWRSAGPPIVTILTLNTNSNTDLFFSGNQTGADITSHLPALTVHHLGLNTHATLYGNITAYGDFGISIGTVNLGAFTLTVYRQFDNNPGAVINATSATINLYGSVYSWGADETQFLTTATTTLNILGSGTLANMTSSGARNIGVFNMNRAGSVLVIDGGAAHTFQSLTINGGTVRMTDGAVHTVATTTNIGANGTLDLSNSFAAGNGMTFTGAVSGAGKILANNGAAANAPVLTFSGAYSFTGNLVTSSNTSLIFNTGGGDVSLNSSVTNLNLLRIANSRKVTLNNNLTFAGEIGATEFVAGEIVVNGYTLTFGLTYTDAGAAWTLSAENSSLVFVGEATFTAAATYNIDETTNLEFRDVFEINVNIGFSKCKNLTTRNHSDIRMDFTVYGNLTVAGNFQFILHSEHLTVYGNTSIDAQATFTISQSTVTFHGLLSGEANYVTDSDTHIFIKGNSSQFVLPYTLGENSIPSSFNLGSINVDRPSGMKLNNNISVGDVHIPYALSLIRGKLDLNGNVLRINFSSSIMETAGNTVINTGASGNNNGYLLVTSSATNIIESSGIGIVELVAAGNIEVRRYPITVPIVGVGLSTKRVYQILGNEVTSATFEYDNSELFSSANDLKLYTATSTDMAFANAIDQTVSNGSNRTFPTAPTGKGRVRYSLMKETPVAAGSFYALASTPGDGGVMRFASANGNWGNANTWSPAGIPSKIDQVVIGPATVTLNGNGVTYEAKTLVLIHPNSTLLPRDNNINGDVVNLRVMGDIELTAGSEILGVNGQGRINLIIGDGITTGVSSSITVNNDYVPTSGLWIHNLSVNTADLTISGGNSVRITGNIELIANSDVNLSNIELWGGYSYIQNISVPSSANLTLETVILANNANVSTQSDYTLKNHFLAKTGTNFNSTGGTAFFTNPNGSGSPWNIENGAIFKLNNVEFNSNAVQSFAPIGNAYIQGNFLQYNSADFAPASGRIIFSNTSQKEIVNTQSANDLSFYEIEVTPGSKIVTSSSWNIAKEIDVKAGGSLIADNGTITMDGTAPLYIKNASTQTLEFNNLTINSNTFTSDSWTIKGNLTTSQALTADKGTITFDNIQQKTITPTVPPTFFKIKVADGSKVTTGNPYNFTIANNSTNPLGAGIEVAGTGEFIADQTAVITFDAGIGISSGNPKTISKSPDGKLEIGILRILAGANNEVATASDFTLSGTGNAFNNEGAGGKFTDTAGKITFTGESPIIRSVSPGVSQFYSIRTLGITALTFPAVAQEIYIAGDITLDGQSTFLLNGVAQTNSKVIFNGNGLQTIAGNSTALTPISLADVVINKTDDSELLLDINTRMGEQAGHELSLVNGILNLGNKTFTNGASIISRIDGVINGGTGTYVIAANHQDDKLEDAYFTIGGIPTLYNLTVNFAHTTANTLTVNGTLNLNTANLTIGTGASASSPIMLVLNGDLTRTTGVIAGGVANSRLVLQGSGSVAGGLSNSFFGGTETTAQLEIARAEVLGGNLNIADDADLRINTGINDFDLGTNTLTFVNTFSMVMISGGIKSGLNSSVVIPLAVSIPASMFRNNEVYNISLSGATSLNGDLKINGTLSMNNNFHINTNGNILTFAQNANIPVFSSQRQVIGKLRRYVTNSATYFPLGNGTNFVPITLQFANIGSVQPILISTLFADPTLNKGGNPSNSVDVLWTITPEGVAINDSIKAIFSWHSTIDGGTTASVNASFPAKWSGTYWTDYRNKLNNFALTDQRVLTMSGFALTPATLAGEWAVFNATANTNAAKDAAINVSGNKIVITEIEPSPVVLNNAFKVTIQLQDRYGQPIQLAEPFAFTLSKTAQSVGIFSDVNGVIPAGESTITMSGLSISGTAGGNHQLLIDTTGTSPNWIPSVSQLFDVLPTMPTSQATNIQFSNVAATSMRIGWANGAGNGRIVLIKPDTLLLANEFPISGTTYFANTIVGAGSNIGNATVVYNGTDNFVNITGLAPNTTYFIYVFEYNGVFGANENYRTTAASGNPRSQATVGSYDDDVTYGENNTRATSKTIGTNTPIKATMRDASDEDWFNFTVTNVSPNVRAQIYNLPGNYTLELYDMDGRRIRRSTLGGRLSEAAVINNLPSGTYTVRIFSQDGSYWTRPGEEYILKVSTFGNEIYAVTP